MNYIYPLCEIRRVFYQFTNFSQTNVMSELEALNNPATHTHKLCGVFVKICINGYYEAAFL